MVGFRVEFGTAWTILLTGLAIGRIFQSQIEFTKSVEAEHKVLQDCFCNRWVGYSSSSRPSFQTAFPFPSH